MKKILSVLCVMFLAFGLVACSGATSEPKKEEAATGATLAQFEQVQTGMSYEEVVGIFGAEGTKSSTIQNMETYTWEGSETLSSAIITFTDGIVSVTMQMGLK